MFLITFLEGSGYMERAAFVMDRLMHSIGLPCGIVLAILLGLVLKATMFKKEAPVFIMELPPRCSSLRGLTTGRPRLP